VDNSVRNVLQATPTGREQKPLCSARRLGNNRIKIIHSIGYAAIRKFY
jgi:hypothetical protein